MQQQEGKESENQGGKKEGSMPEDGDAQPFFLADPDVQDRPAGRFVSPSYRDLENICQIFSVLSTKYPHVVTV